MQIDRKMQRVIRVQQKDKEREIIRRAERNLGLKTGEKWSEGQR